MLALPGPLTSSSPEAYRISFHQGFLNTYSAPDTVLTMSSGPAACISFCLHRISMTKALSTPFFRGGDWGLRRESDLPQTMKLAAGCREVAAPELKPTSSKTQSSFWTVLGEYACVHTCGLRGQRLVCDFLFQSPNCMPPSPLLSAPWGPCTLIPM